MVQTRRTQLTDLEFTVLGVVMKKAPCTAYAVMREFSTSPSSYYRGSAGTIYPLVRRLLRRGYLRAYAGKRGSRPQVDYQLSRKGTNAVRRWLTPPLPESAAAITFDPLRARTYFLGVLKPGERRAFVADAIQSLGEQIRVVEAEVRRYRDAGDAFSALAMEGAVGVIRARLTWMKRLAKHKALSQKVLFLADEVQQ